VATVDVTVSSDLSPERAWNLASDLHRIGEWLTIFGGWRTEIPSRIGLGTGVSSLIKVKGFRAVIHWKVTRYEEPRLIELTGRGRGGMRISLRLEVEDHHPGSRIHVTAELSGGLLDTRVGRLVAKLIESEVRKSAANLSKLC
jgi:uncharacterized protein YndB with AHSA1/START domain